MSHLHPIRLHFSIRLAAGLHLTGFLRFRQGLYPESSGILDKEMLDPKLGEHFKFGGEYTPPLWYLGKPVWIPDPKNEVRDSQVLCPVKAN